MRTHLATFATEDMSLAKARCIQSGLANGITPRCVHQYYPSHPLIESLKRLHPRVFNAGRGAGLWAWKPALVNHLLGPSGFVNGVRAGDVIVYSDSGVEFINDVSHIIDRMDQDIFLFGNQWEHAHWCKRDIVEAVWPFSYEPQPVTDSPSPFGPEYERTPWAKFGKQVQASVIFFRVSDYTRKFVKEWLDWCLFEGGRLIDDSPSRTPNHPEFRENRHDQAILTTMAYREGIKLHWWPAQYNDGAFTYERGDYPDEGHPVLFSHHRRRNHEWARCA